MKARTIGAALGAAGIALMLAACGSSAARQTSLAPGRTPGLPTASPAGGSTGDITIRGRQVITGDAAGKTKLPSLPVTVTGLVADHGHIGLNGKLSGTLVIPLAKGGLLVRYKGKNEKGHLVKATCTRTPASAGKYKVLPGGTGAYKGASGRGVFMVTFTEVERWNAQGQCMTKSKPKSLTVVFKARGPLTLAAK